MRLVIHIVTIVHVIPPTYPNLKHKVDVVKVPLNNIVYLDLIVISPWLVKRLGPHHTAVLSQTPNAGGSRCAAVSRYIVSELFSVLTHLSVLMYGICIKGEIRT